ncbi:MAG: hypothetical protein ACRCXD_08160 [Luteolibacter sp.]
MNFPSLRPTSAAILVGLGACASLIAAPVRFVPMTREIAACKITVKDSKGTTNLKNLSPQTPSGPYQLKVDETPLELTTPDIKDADGKSASLEIPLPADQKSALILLLSDPQHPSGIRAICLDDSTAGFTWGTLRFLNLTAAPLTLRLGEDRKPLPEDHTPVDFPAPAEAQNIGVQLYKETAPAKILYSAVWEHDPNFRKWVVITPGVDPAIRAVDVQILPEDKRIKK